MTPGQWKAIAKIFDQALERDPNEWRHFVSRQCPNDPDLQTEILKLLCAHQMAGDFLEKPAASPPFSEGSSRTTVVHRRQILASRFQIVRELGEGGMGQVFEATDLELQEPVALKVLRPEIAVDSRALGRFKREVQLARRVTHPNVCRTFSLERELERGDTGHLARTPLTFLTMELLTGETLSERLRRAPLSREEVVSIVCQVVDALEAAHQVGVIHRDLKPSNIFLVPSSAGVRAVVTDFGVAAVYGAADNVLQVTADHSGGDRGALLGTLAYMAPEQLEGTAVSPATDVYALGLVLFEMVTRHRPYASEKPLAEAVNRLKYSPPTPLSYAPDLDVSWERAILQCLQISPSNRFQCPRDAFQALAAHNTLQPKAHAPQASHSRSFVLGLLTRLSRFQKYILAPLVVVSLFSAGTRLYIWNRNRPAVPEGSTLMLTQIENEIRDPQFDGVTELLRNQLRQSKYVNVLGDAEIRETEQRMGKAQFAQPDAESAREIAMREGVPLVLFGTVSKLADEYKLDLKLEKVGNQPFYAASSWRFGQSAANKKEFFEIVDRGATWVRQTAGEAAPEIRENARHPEEVTTDSWEALKLYTDGQQRAASDDLDSAVLLFKQATVVDPQFAMAYMRVGDILDTQGNHAEGFSYWKKALAVSGARHLAGREELRMRGMFANDVGDLKASVDFFGQYSVAFPTDYLGYFFRAYPLMLMAQPEEAIRMLQLADDRSPRSYYVLDHLARYNLILGNLTESSRLTSLVRSIGHPDEAALVEGQTAFLRGDFRQAEVIFSSLHSSPDSFVRTASYYQSGALSAEQGKYRNAISILEEGANVDAKFGAVADQADKLLAISYLDLKKGDLAASRDSALAALRLEGGLRRSADAAVVLARGGWVRDAELILVRVHKQQQYEPLSKSVSERVQGEILLAQDRQATALTALRRWADNDQEKAALHDSLVFALARTGRSQDAYTELQAMRRYPGQIWHQPEAYLPGADADLLFLAATQATRLKRPEARDLLVEYCKRRENSDPNLPEVDQAVALLRRLGN